MTEQAQDDIGTGGHKLFSPRRVWAIASNTLTQLVRMKVFYFLLVFVVKF